MTLRDALHAASCRDDRAARATGSRKGDGRRDFEVHAAFPASSVVPMEAALRRAWEKGRAAWPKVELDEEVFAAHVLSKLAPDAGAEEVDRLDAAGLYLACACARGVPSALAELDLHVLAKVPEFLARIQGSSALPDEVRQILRERLLVGAGGEPPRIATYSGEGPLAAWVRVAAVRTALNLLEKMDERLGHDSRAIERADAATTPEQEVAASPPARDVPRGARAGGLGAPRRAANRAPPALRRGSHRRRDRRAARHQPGDGRPVALDGARASSCARRSAWSTAGSGSLPPRRRASSRGRGAGWT